MTVERTTKNRDNSIRIWGIISLYDPNFSGAAIQAHRVLTGLARKGFEVKVLTCGNRKASSLRGQEIEKDGITVKYLLVPPYSDWNSLSRIPILHRIVAYFYGLLIRFFTAVQCAFQFYWLGKPEDIVEFYDIYEFSFIPVWMAKFKGMHPVIRMSLVGSDDPLFHLSRIRKGNFFAGLTMLAFYKVETIVGLSTALVTSCAAAGLDPNRVLRIPNGVDLSTFHPIGCNEKNELKESFGLSSDRRYVVFVGLTVQRKGIDVLVKSFMEVAKRIDDVDLLVVGRCDFGDDYNLRKEHELVEDLKNDLVVNSLDTRVHWIGPVSNAHEYLQVADLFCFPTRREGLPNVVGEAMGVGLPVVLSVVDGITTDFFETDDQGILVNGFDPTDYAEVLLRVLEDSALSSSLGKNARNRAEAEYGLERVVERYNQLYQGIANRKQTQ